MQDNYLLGGVVDLSELNYCKPTTVNTNFLYDHKRVDEQTANQEEIVVQPLEGEELLQCNFPGCLKEFSSRWSLTRHTRTHTGERPFKCLLCGKEFVQKCSLKRHEQTHSHEKQWICMYPNCGKSFKLKEYLDVHKRTHVKPRIEIIHNDKADNSSQQDSGEDTKEIVLFTDQNEELVDGEEALYCTFRGCYKAFSSRWSLTRHTRTHTGERPFKCNLCGKEFVQKCSLKRHEQTHAQDKQWICDFPQCGKRFKLKEYLDVHRRTHVKIDVRDPEFQSNFRSTINNKIHSLADGSEFKDVTNFPINVNNTSTLNNTVNKTSVNPFPDKNNETDLSRKFHSSINNTIHSLSDTIHLHEMLRKNAENMGEIGKYNGLLKTTPSFLENKDNYGNSMIKGVSTTMLPQNQSIINLMNKNLINGRNENNSKTLSSSTERMKEEKIGLEKNNNNGKKNNSVKSEFGVIQDAVDAASALIMLKDFSSPRKRGSGGFFS